MPDNYISQIDFGDGVIRKLKAEGGGGGTGLYIGDVSNLNADYTINVKKVTLTWTDPDDIEISGVKQAEWAGTVIVRKEGSVPISSGDGTVVINSTVRNQYTTNGFEDTSIEFETEYYYRAFPYTTAGQSTNGKYVSVMVMPKRIYGVEWDGTATSVWTRTDDAAEFEDPNPYYAGMEGTPSSPFDNIRPWSEMVVETHTGVGSVVKIPKFWYKLTQNGSGLKIQITNESTSGFSVSPAHKNRGDGKGERDYIYVGRYHCGSGYTSTSGSTPLTNGTRSTNRSGIHNLGSTIWQMDFATRFTIWLLYLVEFADWNSQAKIGYGCGTERNAESVGYTDSMPYHTGTTQTDRTSYILGTQYRYIEGLWDNCLDWLDGCYYDNSGLNIILNPSKFADNAYGTLVGKPSNGPSSAFSLSNVSGAFSLFIPSAGAGGYSYSAYMCDQWDYYEGDPCISAGGAHYQGNLASGLFRIRRNGMTDKDVYTGCRLMELP